MCCSVCIYIGILDVWQSVDKDITTEKCLSMLAWARDNFATTQERLLSQAFQSNTIIELEKTAQEEEKEKVKKKRKKKPKMNVDDMVSPDILISLFQHPHFKLSLNYDPAVVSDSVIVELYVKYLEPEQGDDLAYVATLNTKNTHETLLIYIYT